MTQDRDSGAGGDAFGRQTAPPIARAIGAVMNELTSNRATFEGLRSVIKCAGQRTTSVGVTYKMLDDLDTIIGAFEQESGLFDVRVLPVAIFRANVRPTRSRGPSAGKVGLVSRRVFLNQGIPIATVPVLAP